MSQYHIYQTDAEYSFRGWQDTKSKFEINDYKKCVQRRAGRYDQVQWQRYTVQYE